MNDIERAIDVFEQAIKRFDSQLPDIERKMLNELLGLVKQMKTGTGGNILPDIENLKLVNKIKSKLGKIIDRGKLNRLVDATIKWTDFQFERVMNKILGIN
jgi:hypothetical protein